MWSVFNTVKPWVGFWKASPMGPPKWVFREGMGKPWGWAGRAKEGDGSPHPEKTQQALPTQSVSEVWVVCFPTYPLAGYTTHCLQSQSEASLYFNSDPNSAMSPCLILYVCSLCLFSFFLSFLVKFPYENSQSYFSQIKEEVFSCLLRKIEGISAPLVAMHGRYRESKTSVPRVPGRARSGDSRFSRLEQFLSSCLSFPIHILQGRTSVCVTEP